ncbi:FecR domain-containing protein [Sphingobium sp. H39-3-25]|uniref:FecR family protein n=1 Tax=Sphingobium arseniciresistens TaxID=3030834 RepID=UPI0023B8C626|nr:FecR domain-containing protein [Sphingobium arseniciresistens]
MEGNGSTHIYDQADAWVARMDAEGWSADDEAELQAWLAGDYRRRGALLEAQAAWMSLDGNQHEMVPDRVHAAPRSFVMRRRTVIAGGAALAASLGAGVLFLNRGESYVTGLGEVRLVPLADGSSATINSASQLSVSFSKRSRDVQIAKGEAWFRVSKDPARPFVVQAGSVLVSAIGTAFSVRRRDNGADIIVSEGVIESWAQGADGHRVRVVAGQRAFVGNNSEIRVETSSMPSVERLLAWREGTISLAGDTLAYAIADFNRYNARKLVLNNQQLGQQQIDGVFRLNDPVGFASAIGKSFNVPIDLANPDRVEIGKATR